MRVEDRNALLFLLSFFQFLFRENLGPKTKIESDVDEDGIFFYNPPSPKRSKGRDDDDDLEISIQPGPSDDKKEVIELSSDDDEVSCLVCCLV